MRVVPKSIPSRIPYFRTFQIGSRTDQRLTRDSKRASYTEGLPKYCLLGALVVLYLTSLGAVGFLGPDEPRYASIGRGMATSGDWLTPRLDGQPWFEKPPLLYWMTATGNLLGLSDEWAARLPVALAGIAFLMFFYHTLEREFSRRVALYATAILGTSAGWASLSFAAVTDLPMSAALGAAMLIGLFGPSAYRGAQRGREPNQFVQGLIAGTLLGLAILAKGFVPLVLMAPVFLVCRGKRLGMIVAALVIAGPWYAFVSMRYGAVFWDDFFWRQYVLRIYSSALEHEQPFWYYLPVFLAGLFPWTPLIAMVGRRQSLDDVRVRFLLFWVIGVLILFSIPLNKLPAYILPALPPSAIILAVSLDKLKAHQATAWLAGCTLLLAVVPVIAGILPDALLSGISKSELRFAVGWPFLLAAAGVGWLAWMDRKEWAVLTAAIAAVAALLYLKSAAFPPMEERVSVRGFWRAHQPQAARACVDGVARTPAYGLNYYAGRPLESCEGGSPRIVMQDGRLALE
jgi:4-amino-4-deoxy-L-arabinose transferase-like glycosyltransferase